MSKYEEVYKLLSDEKSRNVFMDILTWKISLDSSKLVDANYESSNEQYFEPFEFLTKDEVFVDCGGFIGDSTMALLRHGGGVKKVFLIVTIDEDIDEKVTFVKMDIEGFELQALQGAARHIITEKVSYMQFPKKEKRMHNHAEW